jgi:hypothetical protein
VLVAFATFGCATQTSAPKVQLRSLVEHPQLYEGKVVVVDGFFAFGKEGDAICNELREDVRAFCVAIERSGIFLDERGERYSALQGHRVSFAGQFMAVSRESSESACPVGVQCVLIDLTPPFQLRMTSKIHLSR